MLPKIVFSFFSGGVSYINQRNCKAGVVKTEEGKTVTKLGFIDANNLYGYAQCQPMPLRDFKWLSEDETKLLTTEKIMTLNVNGEKGLIFEVDLEYPENLHESHSSFPLAPEHFKISYDILSPYAKECHKILTKKKSYKSKKLCATFHDRKNYVIHFANLISYLKLGMKIKNIHRVLSFRQETFLKNYIDICTLLRKKSETDFGKRLWKLFANAVFGKFIEGTRNYLNIKICKNSKSALKYISQPNFSNIKIISKRLVIVFLKQNQVFLNKAYAVGFTILERAKDFMFNEYYLKIKPSLEKIGCDVSVIMSDTDSLCLAMTNEKNFDYISKLYKIIDFSNYEKNSEKYSIENESKLGYWKDELKGDKMLEFTGLRSKSYAFRLKKGNFQSKCKGISKQYKKTINFENFKQCLKKISNHSIKQVNIRSKSHILHTLEVEKICFSSFDDKRYLFNCGIHSVPYGSKLINKNDVGKCIYCHM